MLSTKTDHSSYKTYLNCPFDRFLAILLGHFTQWISSGHSCPHQHTVSVQIVSQIPQPHLGSYPHQTYGAHDQLPRPLRLHPKDMFHSTPDSGTRSITLEPLDPSASYACTPSAEDAPDSFAPSALCSFSSERYAESAHTSRLLLSSSKRSSKT